MRSSNDGDSLEGFVTYLEGVKDKYLSVLKPYEVRVSVDRSNRASVRFLNFPGGSFSAVIDTNCNAILQSPGGHSINLYVGGRDDAFYNDLP